jgi:hypothetical protein
MSLYLAVPPFDTRPLPVRVVVSGTSLERNAEVVFVDNGTRLTLDDAFLLCGRPSPFLTHRHGGVLAWSATHGT